MDKNKVMNFIKVLTFNILETVIIFLLGNVFKVDVNIRIMLMVSFFLTRMVAGKPKHYNKAYRCALWSFLVFLSLYSLSSLELPVIILLTIFTGFISTGRADINDLFMWKGKETKYQDIIDFIKFNEYDDKLIEFEKKLKDTSNVEYLVYKYRFKEQLTFDEISERIQIASNRITEIQEKIAFAIRLYCGI